MVRARARCRGQCLCVRGQGQGVSGLGLQPFDAAADKNPHFRSTRLGGTRATAGVVREMSPAKGVGEYEEAPTSGVFRCAPVCVYCALLKHHLGVLNVFSLSLQPRRPFASGFPGGQSAASHVVGGYGPDVA